MTQTTPIDEALEKQPTLVKHFMHLLKLTKLSHAYLFAGMTGSGKKAVALTVALALFCEQPGANGVPCGRCVACQQILAADNPDVVTVAPEGTRIKVDQVRHVKEEFTKSAVGGRMKVFIIEGAETLTDSAANGLLKFIEEPADNRVVFLLTTNKSLILPTIISRTQLIEFKPLVKATFKKTLQAEQISSNQADLLAVLTNSVETAHEWVQQDWLADVQSAVGRWYSQLTKGDEMAFVTVQTALLPLAIDRQRQAVILDALIVIWQQTMNLKYLKEDGLAFPQLAKTMQQVAASTRATKLLAMVEAALATKQDLAGNMNFQSIVETLTLTGFSLLQTG